MEPLGVRLRRLRLARGLAVKDVAKALAVAQSTYRDWESGRAIRGSERVYSELARVFGVSVSQIVLGDRSDHAWLLAQLDKIDEIVRQIRGEL